MDFPQSSEPPHTNPFPICHACPWGREKWGEGAMRLLFAIGIVALIGIGITLQIRFPPNRVAVVEATAPIYIIDANHVKTLPEQETPLP